MTGNVSAANWIAKKLRENPGFTVHHIGSGLLEITREDHDTFVAGVTGVDVVRLKDVMPLFGGARGPHFVVNVPSRAIWEGNAIDFIHQAPAAFGTVGDLVRASREEPVWDYRNKNDQFFEQAFRQHTAVESVNRLYDRLYQLRRKRGRPNITVVLLDAYHLSAQDVRHARDLYGKFDVALKMTSYGSITTAAENAARSMGAEALKFGDLMGRLNRP